MDLRQRILKATRQLLLAEGYDSISMRRIGQAVGVSATTLYLYYDSKHTLFEALVDEGMGLLYEELRSSLTGDDDPRSDFEKLCRAYLEFGLSNPEYYEIMFVLRPNDLPRFAAEKYRRARRNLDVVVAVLARMYPGCSQERLRVMASATWAALHGAVTLLNAQRIDRSISKDEFLETVVGLASPPVIALTPRQSPTESTNRLV